MKRAPEKRGPVILLKLLGAGIAWLLVFLLCLRIGGGGLTLFFEVPPDADGYTLTFSPEGVAKASEVKTSADGTELAVRLAPVRHGETDALLHWDGLGEQSLYDSDIESRNVHTFRRETGRLLATEAPADADIVVGVPDSSLSAAMGYSDVSGLPYEMGLIKNRYVARTFIQPLQEMRERGVVMKLSAVRSIVNGKRIVLVDDSIVRGTTILKIIKILRNAGAAAVHVRIASPMMTNPCFYGVDTSTKEELLCNGRTLEEACQEIGADSLGYISPEGSRASSFGCSDLCLACFTGEYPTDLYRNGCDGEK